MRALKKKLNFQVNCCVKLEFGYSKIDSSFMPYNEIKKESVLLDYWNKIRDFL